MRVKTCRVWGRLERKTRGSGLESGNKENWEGQIPFPGLTDIVNAASSEQRNIAIYLIRKKTGAMNREVGEIFGGLTHSAIAKIYRKMIKDIRGDGKLRREISQLQKILDNFKG